tara:strand:+ start:21 stop:1820 length:1800 start_codon:yes stop_codon:yes gene_type:complete
MAFTTGPDFLTGILGASNAGNVFNSNLQSNSGNYQGLDAFENRYGQQIGDDGFLTGGIITTAFYDSDGDGIDDRFQSGPGQPKAGSNPNANPGFPGGGGGGNPPLGGGAGSDARRALRDDIFNVRPYNPNAMRNTFGFDDNPNYPAYEPMSLREKTKMYYDQQEDTNQNNFLEGFNVKNLLPGGLVAKGLAKGLGFLERKLMPEYVKEQADKLTSEAFKERYGNFMDKYGTEEAPQDINYDFNPNAFNPEQIAGLGSRYGLTGSYADQLQAAQDFTQSTIEQKNNLALGLKNKANEYGFLDDDFSLGDLSNSTVADLEDQALGANMNMTNQYNTALKEQAEREARQAQAEQDRINNAVASGKLGFGQDEDGNYRGLVNADTGGVNTGYNPNIQNEKYQSRFSQAEKNRVNSQIEAKKEAKKGFEQAQKSVKRQAEQNKARREKNKNKGRKSSNKASGRSNRGRASPGKGGCFIKGTMIEMANGTEKEITSINVGEETKGGTVEAKLEFMPHNIYDYKGVKVSGSHWVMEDGQFTEIENSKHGVLTDMIEPVYNFITSKHRIFIKGVEFGGFYSQDPNNYEPYFKQEKDKINKELSEKTH